MDHSSRSQHLSPWGGEAGGGGLVCRLLYGLCAGRSEQGSGGGEAHSCMRLADDELTTAADMASGGWNRWPDLRGEEREVSSVMARAVSLLQRMAAECGGARVEQTGDLSGP